MKKKLRINENFIEIVNYFKKDKIFLLIIFLFIIYTVSFALLRYFKFDYNYNFGYLDHQLYWEALHRLLDGQVLYKDFYWEYGPLYLIYSLPIFVLLNKTFSAYIFVRFIIIPITGVVVAYFLGKELLKGRYLALFLLISVMYSALNFTSIRHIIAELGLVITLLGLYTDDKKKIIKGTTILGISLTAGIEYALISSIVLTLFIIWLIYHKGKGTNYKNIAISYIGYVIGSAVFFGYLFLNEALGNYVNFFKEFSTSFFYLSPCRLGFPKLNTQTFSSIVEFRRLNLFVLPLINATIFIYLYLKERKKELIPVFMVFLVYSGIGYFRTSVNPCLITVPYSSTLLLLVVVYLLKYFKDSKWKGLIYLVIFWLMLTAAPKGPVDFVRIIMRKDTTEKEYLNGADIYLDKEKVEIIVSVVDYIKEVTNEGDYVYVYPYGPYNQLTNTKSPVNVAISTHFELAPFLVPKVIENLEINKPEYIVVNRINAWSYLAAMYIIPQSMSEHEGAPVFVADLTDVEKYISMNYTIDKKFDQVWVLKRRIFPIEYTPPYIKKDVSVTAIKLNNFENTAGLLEDQKLYITGPNPEVVLGLESLEDVDLVKFPNKVNLGLFKYTSQYTLQAFLFSASGQLLNTRADIMSMNWQKLWMEVRNDKRLKDGALIVLRLSDNRGIFSLGGAPRSIELKYPEFYQLNPIIFDK